MRRRGGNLREELYKGLSEILQATPDTYLTAAWRPNPVRDGAEYSPQEMAFDSEADETGFGGKAGGGKTSWLVGTPIRQHYKTIIFRREYTEFREIDTQISEIVGDLGRWHGKYRTWHLPGGRTLRYGAAKSDQDCRGFRGDPHDCYAFDELTEWPMSQFVFLTGWNRTNRPNQRCRIITTFNPPTTSEGQWVIERYGPWIEPGHSNPAKPGELRWFINVKSRDMEVQPTYVIQVDGRTIYLDDLPESSVVYAHGKLPRATYNGVEFIARPTDVLIEGEPYLPSSRTFVPSGMDDNPYIGPEYRAKIDQMPEPLRTQLKYGDFGVGRTDDPWQIIPSAWIDEAFARWKRCTIDLGAAGVIRPEDCQVLQQLGGDVARDGNDECVLAKRYGKWFAWPIYIEKDDLLADHSKRSGGYVGRRILAEIDSDTKPLLMIDLLNVGTSVVDWLVENCDFQVYPFTASARTSPGRTVQGGLQIANDRTWAYWNMRQLLDPQNGHELMLPPSPKLRADLTAPRYEIRSGTIHMESKDKIKLRLGRSTDTGDAYTLAALEDLVPVFRV